MKEFFKTNGKGIIIGLVVGVLVMYIFWPKRIAKLENGEEVSITVKDKTITADSLYSGLKLKYGASEIVQQVDKLILDEKYKLTESDLEEINKSKENYYSTFESYYGIKKEQFLKQNNFDSEEDFVEYLKLEYKRNLLVEEYLKAKVTDKDIKDYYKENYFAPFKVEHILVKTSSSVTKDEAKATAEKILKALKGGSSWEEVKTKYKDDITTENFTVEFDSSLEENFVKAAKKLKDNKYTTSLVETSYGYHIILRTETKEKENVSDIKDRLITKVVSQEKNKDTNYYQKTLVIMRKEAGMEIKDIELKKVYDNFVSSLETTKSE